MRSTVVAFFLAAAVLVSLANASDDYNVPNCGLEQNPCGSEGNGARRVWFYDSARRLCKESGTCDKFDKHGYDARFKCEKAHKHCP